MRRLALPLATLSLAAAAFAQTPAVNDFHVYTDRTSFTSRGFLGGAAGETLQGYPAAQYRGIGDAGAVPKAGVVHGLGMITQDQDQKTVEEYAVIFRRADVTGMAPDGTAAGIIAKTGKLKLPTGSGTGPIAWDVTVNLGANGVEVPSRHTFFAGLALDANAKWTSDGQSTHASAYTTPASTAGDPVRDKAPSHAYQVDDKGAVRATNPRSWNYRLQTRRGAFQIGAIQGTNALYGNCGNYPDPDTHGLAFRIRDKAMAEKIAAVFVSDSLIGGAPLPWDGNLWINPGTLVLVGQGKLSTAGVLELRPALFAPGKLKALKGIGNLPFQAFILDIGSGRFDVRTTNAQATNL